MRKVTMVRLGIAAAITALGAIGAGASGCTSDDNSTTTGDSGTPGDSGTQGDSNVVTTDDGGGNPDTGVVPDSAAPIDARLIVVHAAPGLGPVRLCFGISNGTAASTVATNALPDNPLSVPPYALPPSFLSDGGTGTVAAGTPGIYPGTIGAFPDITSLQKIAIVPYLIDATLVANQTSAGGTGDGGTELQCPQLVGLHGLGTTVDGALLTASQFTTLATIPAQTFLDGSTYLLSLTGCVGSFTVSETETELGVTATGVCGSDFVAGTSNVAVGIAPIDTTTPITDGGWGVQFAHRSTSIQGTPVPLFSGNPPEPTGDAHLPASQGLQPGFVVESLVEVDAGPDGGDAGTTVSQGFTPIAAAPIVTSPEPAGGKQITAIQTVTVDPTTSAFGVLTYPGSSTTVDGGIVPLPFPYSATADGVVFGDLFAIPLGVGGIASLSDWAASTATSPTTYAPGTAFTFVVLGSDDFTVPQLLTASGTSNVGDGGTYDGRGLHIVAFPNNFTAIPNTP